MLSADDGPRLVVLFFVRVRQSELCEKKMAVALLAARTVRSRLAGRLITDQEARHAAEPFR